MASSVMGGCLGRKMRATANDSVCECLERMQGLQMNERMNDVGTKTDATDDGDVDKSANNK